MQECDGSGAVGHAGLPGELVVAMSGMLRVAAGEGLNPPPFWQA